MSTKPQRKPKQERGKRPSGQTKASADVAASQQARARRRAAIPDESFLKAIAEHLNSSDQEALRRIVSELTEHLGSPEAARLWLVTRAPEFGTTPEKAIRSGKARVVLAVLESQWGPNATYA
jgi:hypothetical protein